MKSLPSVGPAADIFRPGTAHAGPPSVLRAWLLASRPHTLTIALAPVVVGTALALADTGHLDVPVMIVALLAAVLIQVGTNLQNDVGDFERGADRADRLGPPRATSQGWLGVAQVRRGAGFAFGLALALGTYLVWRGGWPILLTGLASIAAGIAYTTGRRPIAYTALGEVFVFAFFGLVAVCGSYYLQTGTVGASVIVAGTMIGMLAAAVLAVNNYRDIDTDRQVGKHTLAACMGGGFARAELSLLVLLPFALLPAFALLAGRAAAGVLPLLTLPWAASVTWRIYRRSGGAWLNGVLAETALLELAFATALAVAVVA